MTAPLSPTVLALIALLSLALACVSEEGPGFEVPDTVEYPETTFFQPFDAATSSQWSNTYAIEHTIDGSGLPENFGPADEHADYGADNHWTTSDGDIEGAYAVYGFEEATSMDTLYIWHHRSTMPPAYSENYAITRFDVAFLDRDGEALLVLEDLEGVPGLASAAVYPFEQVDGVFDVEITVKENAGEDQVTGLAEVGFGLSL